MGAHSGTSLLRVPFGIAPADYSGPFVSIPLADRSGDLLLINTGATAADLDALQEPGRRRRHTVMAWSALVLAASVFATIWLATTGSSLVWLAPLSAAVLSAGIGFFTYFTSRRNMVEEQAEIISVSPQLLRSPLVPGQGRRSLGAGIADHFNGIPEQTDDENERQLRYEMAHFLRGYADKFGTADESAGMVELMNAESSLKTLRSMQQDRLAA